MGNYSWDEIEEIPTDEYEGILKAAIATKKILVGYVHAPVGVRVDAWYYPGHLSFRTGRETFTSPSS
ncbi:MAG: hypothetical protein F6J98_01920 [Moorea sp. SIO4G2]|nr:hypothetical protein [Moorena sp. SIO4G2]